MLDLRIVGHKERFACTGLESVRAWIEELLPGQPGGLAFQIPVAVGTGLSARAVEGIFADG